MGAVGKHSRLTPVHLFTVEYADGSTRKKAIPGMYSEVAAARERVTAKLPDGAKIIDSSWRADYSAITKPGNAQADYQHAPPVVCGLLAYYDESPKWLRQLVETLPLAGVSRLVAVDGAYRLYPNARPKSPTECEQTLRAACDKAGIVLHHHTPAEVWDDELHKRSFLFEQGEQVTEDHDWYFVIDADERVTQAPQHLPHLLDKLDTLVAEATLWAPDSRMPLRMFFRAKRGLRVVGNHYTYQLPDGRRLWGNWNDTLELATPIPVLVEHRDRDRPRWRLDRKFAYYDLRDAEAPEVHSCTWCGTETSQCVPWNWRVFGEGIVADRAGCCSDCFPDKLEESIAHAAELGVDASHLRTDRAFR